MVRIVSGRCPAKYVAVFSNAVKVRRVGAFAAVGAGGALPVADLFASDGADHGIVGGQAAHALLAIELILIAFSAVEGRKVLTAFCERFGRLVAAQLAHGRQPEHVVGGGDAGDVFSGAGVVGKLSHRADLITEIVGQRSHALVRQPFAKRRLLPATRRGAVIYGAHGDGGTEHKGDASGEAVIGERVCLKAHDLDLCLGPIGKPDGLGVLVFERLLAVYQVVGFGNLERLFVGRCLLDFAGDQGEFFPGVIVE